MGGEQEMKQQAGVPKSSGNQGGKAQLADMDGRPFLDGAVPMPEPRTARGRPSVYSQELAERIFDEIECGLSIEKIATLPGMPSKRTARHQFFTAIRYCGRQCGHWPCRLASRRLRNALRQAIPAQPWLSAEPPHSPTPHPQ